MPMTPDAKSLLSKTIRQLRERLIDELERAMRGDYQLGVAAAKAQLPEARSKKRARLDAWVDEQVRSLGNKVDRPAATARFRREIAAEAAYTLLNRLVYIRLLEAAKLRPTPVVTGGWRSLGYQDFRDLAQALIDDDTEGYATLLRIVFDELALDLPGLFGRERLSELIRVPAGTLRLVVEALDDPALSSCWTDQMTLGWIYQYFNDPEREALDDKLNAGGKVEPHEIASKTQMFTERYIVDWLLQNSLAPMWLAMCRKKQKQGQGWTPEVESSGTLHRLEARRTDWRKQREAGEASLIELMPLESDTERRWAYYVPQSIPDDAVDSAPDSVRDLKILDPAVGSGHFLVVALDLLVALYREEARHRGEADAPQWSDRAIVERILSHNLHGIDLDPRAVQIAAAALWLEAQKVAPGAQPRCLNLVASNLRLASLPDDDPGLVDLRREVERSTGIPASLTDSVVQALKGADHLGSLLQIDEAVNAAVNAYEVRPAGKSGEQGDIFGKFEPRGQQRLSLEAVRESLTAQLEQFLAQRSASEDLGLRLRGEQLAAGIRFVRMVEPGQYDLVIGNPPYQGTSKMADAKYVKETYSLGKADLYAAFLERGLQFARVGGVSALLTMRNWMFIKQYAGLRKWLLESWDLRALLDLSSGAFEEISGVVVSVVACVLRRTPANADPSVALKAFRSDTVTTQEETPRKRAAVLCHAGRHEFAPEALRVVPEWPLVYWWGKPQFGAYDRGTVVQVSPTKKGLITSDNTRFIRMCWEPRPFQVDITEGRRVVKGAWAPLMSGAKDRRWLEPLTEVILWRSHGLEVKVLNQHKYGSYTRQIMNEAVYFEPGVAFTCIGSEFGARAHRYASVISSTGCSIYPASDDTASSVCRMNSELAREVLSSLNPTIHFTNGDVDRLPLFPVPGAQKILARLELDFDVHECRREQSVEFERPGPTPWRYAQEWAQEAVDRSEGTPLPDYKRQLDPEPPTDHISFALGITLGRFKPTGEGVLDPARDDLSHALPVGLLFLDGTLDRTDTADSLGHAAAEPLHAAWDEHGPIDDKRPLLRDYLRLDFFGDVHRTMYENRPVHWPLSSGKKTFVAWVNIHRLDASTLRTLLAQHLHPTLTRLEGKLTDLRAVRDGADKKEARLAEKHFGKAQKARDELVAFVAAVSQCAEQGPLPPDAKTPAREVNARYDPELDDGVMINSAALWPLLQPQWKEPKKWYKELATAMGRKDYDWSHLAMRYWPSRVDDKCREDPSLAVAHGRFWKYHPARAYAWELRLQDEIALDFTLDEPDSDACRDRFLAEHPQQAAGIREKESQRRKRNAAKAAQPAEETAAEEGVQAPLFKAANAATEDHADA